MATGIDPTGMGDPAASVRVLIGVTVPEPVFATYAMCDAQRCPSPSALAAAEERAPATLTSATVATASPIRLAVLSFLLCMASPPGTALQFRPIILTEGIYIVT
jgi:hypothetical protein